MMKQLLFLSFFLLIVTSAVFSQRIFYSSNKIIQNPNHRYEIVGEINNNVIVWETILNPTRQSKILVYNNSMHLINTINTSILSSDADPDAQFFTNNNSFIVTYQYKIKNVLLYKFAAFNETGNQLYIKTLDSINTNDKSIANETFFYKVLQSDNAQTICFIKMLYDKKYYVLKFNCSFIKGDNIAYNNFILPFNESNETLADVSVDDHNNILILKGSIQVSSVNLKLIKKSFTDETMLIADKTLPNNYAFKESSLHVTIKPAGYLIFGDVENFTAKDSSNHKTELYVWQTDSVLNDAPGDTIINRYENYIKGMHYTANIAADNKFANTFAVWNLVNDDSSEALNSPSAENNNILPVFNKYVSGNAGVYNAQTGIFIPANYYQPPPDYITQPKKYNAAGAQVLSTNKIELFKLNNNNKIVWNDVFTDSIDNLTAAYLGAARIIAGSKGVHIVYEIRTKKHATSLNHIIIYNNGTYTKEFFAAWNPKYDYLLNECILTNDNEIIIPATKGNKLYFTKMKLE